MKQEEFFSLLAAGAVCSLLLVLFMPGCGPLTKEVAVTSEVEPEKPMPKAATVKPEAVKPEPEIVKPIVEKPVAERPVAEEAATIALKFTPQDSTTYKVITEAQQSVKWEGSVPKGSDFESGTTRNRVEMTFTQQLQSINDKGNCIAKITIKDLKYYFKVKGDLFVDFDSSRAEEPDNPLSRLIGQSYTIEITPAGEVAEIVDVSGAQAAVAGTDSSARKAAASLLTQEAVKRRHGIVSLPAAGEKQLQTGQSWDSVKTFSYGLMGAKSYKKSYTLKQIKDINGRRIAEVEMNAAATSEMAEQLHKEQTTDDFSKMFDNIETYTGRLEFDLTAGKIEKSFEKLQTEWIKALPDPSAEEKGPAVLKMGTIRLHGMERIDYTLKGSKCPRIKP